MSELAGEVAATAGKAVASVAVKGGLAAAGGLLTGALPYLALAGLAVSLAGAGTAVWYRMQWKDCQAAGAQALIDQRNLDQQDNMKAVSFLNGKLTANERAYDQAMGVLATIPRNNACERDTGVRAIRIELCRKYPASEACSGSVPAR